MGQIATMLTSVTRTRSPLQRELDTLTKVLGIIAWGAVAVIVVVGLIRGMPADQLLLLGTAMAISAIPTGMPAFVSGLLSMGVDPARRCQGGRQEPHRRRDPRCDERDQHRQDRHPDAEPDDGVDAVRGRLVVHGRGGGLPEDGRHPLGRRGAGARLHPPRPSAWCSTATRSSSDDGSVIGDPTEAALVVLAAKLGVDAAETRRAYPRLAEVPFDSDYKFMATFHRVTVDGVEHVIELVKGAPDVVIARCTQAGGPLSGSQVPMARGPRRHRGGQRADGREGAAGARVRRPARRPATSWPRWPTTRWP